MARAFVKTAARPLYLACLVAICCTVTQGSGSALALPGPVYVFPIPGSQYGSAYNQITIRGVPTSQFGTIIVTGSQSGLHTGLVLSDSDQQGGSFIPYHPFTEGEVVTVQTGLRVVGGQHGSWQFRVAYEAGPNRTSPFYFAPRVPGDVLRFHSRPDLQPAAVRVVRQSSHTARGDIFLAPQVGPVSNGPMIIDRKGQLVWFMPLPGRDFATDVREQRYQGHPVLTFWRGIIRLGTGDGEADIYNTRYQQIAAIRAGNGLRDDFHEFQISRRGTALITAYHPVFIDARSVGGSTHQDTLDSVVQEIDIPTGLVLFQWDSLDHVPLAGTYGPLKKPYNYFHLNSIDEDSDGNLIISGRNTWSAYKVDRHTAKTIWVLGGRRSTFKMGSGAQFVFQHDVRVRGKGDREATIFDDGGAPFVHDARGLVLRLDPRHRQATVLRQDHHTPALTPLFEGNMQLLPDGHDFIGWGQAPYFSEFENGHMIFDARFVDQNLSYRAWRFPWNATPASPPDLAAHASGNKMTVWASWNGATTVSSWQLLAGGSSTALRAIRKVSKVKFETAIPASTASYVAVQALNASGKVIGRSATIPVS